MNARLDPIIERFRFAHHNVAMMFAMGMSVPEVSKKTGFTRRRLIILLDDPTFCELIEHYRAQGFEIIKSQIPDAMELMTHNYMAGLRHIANWFEEADEPGADPLPMPQVVKVTEAMGDRIGFSKHTSKTINMNVSFADQLERASLRSDSVREVKQIEFIEGEILPTERSSAQLTVVGTPPRTYRRA